MHKELRDGKSDQPKPKSTIINGAEIITHPTGQVDIDFEPELPIQTSSYDPKDHFGNLVEVLTPATRATLAGNIVDRVNEDIQSRDGWANQLAKAIELCGQQPDENNNSLPFPGASKAYDPTFLECSTSIEATVSSEFFPPSGPVEIQNIGLDVDEELLRKSQNVKAFMNYALTVEDKSYRSEALKGIKWAIQTGSSFKKVFVNPLTKKLETAMIAPEDLIINSKATSLQKSTLIVQKFRVSAKTLRMYQLQGFYRDVKLSPFLQSIDDNIIGEAVQSKLGIDEDTHYDRNEYYELWECHGDQDIKGFEHTSPDGEPTGLPLPYLIILEPESRQLLRVCRNWEKNDLSYTRINIFVHYYFTEGLGLYGEGLVQKIGNLARTATNMTRICQNASYLASHPGGLRVKSLRNEGNQKRVGPCEWVEIDTGGLPLSDAIMALPYKDASPLMMQMIEGLQTAMRNIAGAAMMDHTNFNPNTPVATTLAFLEKSNVVESSVMRNFHTSLSEELQIMFKFWKEIISDEPFKFIVNGKEHEVSRADFEDNINIVPVSDPNLSSAALRLMRAQELRRMDLESPGIYNSYAINEMVCREMKIDPSIVMMPKQEEEEEVLPLDPITENLHILAGKAVKAGITQNNEAHLLVHGQLEQQLMQDPEKNGDKLAALHAHKQEHEINIYQLQMEMMLGHQLPKDPSKLPIEAQNDLALQAAQKVEEQQQAAAEAAPPPPLDPAAVMMKDVEVKAQLGEQKAHIDQLKIDLETMKMQEEAKQAEQHYQLEVFKLQSKDETEKAKEELARLKAESEEQINYLKMEYEAKVKEQELAIKEQEVLLKEMQLQLNMNKLEKDENINSMSE